MIIEQMFNIRIPESEMKDIVIDYLKYKYNVSKKVLDHIIDNKADSVFDTDNGDFVLIVNDSINSDIQDFTEDVSEDCNCDKQ